MNTNKTAGRSSLVAGALVAILAAPVQAQQLEQTGEPAPSAAAPAGFWSMMRDTSLARLMSQALAANRDVQSAQARLSGARAATTRAALQLTPSVTANAGYSRQRLSSLAVPGGAAAPDYNAWDAGVNMGWEVDVFGRNRKAWRGQQSNAAASQEDLRNVQVQVAAELAAAYFDLVGARDRLATAQRNAENQRRTLQLTEDRLAAGRGNAFDSERARAQLSSTLAALPLLEALIEAIENRIGVLTGQPDVAAGLGSADTRPVLPDSVVVGAVDSLILRRPDVRSALQRSAAQSALAGSATAEYLPRFALVGSAGYLSGHTSNFGDPNTERYTIGAAVSWPLLDLGRVKANADVARAEARDARARYEQSVLLAREDLETSLVTYRRTRERLVHLENAAQASERAAELARQRFQEGATDFLQVLDAERTLLEAQDRRSTGRTDATSALIAIYRALGGNWPAQ